MQDTDFYDELEELFAQTYKDAARKKRMFLTRAPSMSNPDEENFAEEGEVSKDTIARILSGRMETEQDQFDEYWQPDA